MKNISQYSPVEDRQAKLESAVRALTVIVNDNKITSDHKKWLVDKITWLITEVDGKFNVRYRTVGVSNGGNDQVQHEHVFTRKAIKEYLVAHPQEVDETVKLVTGCLVTKSEHERLTLIKEADGWERYAKAGVDVVDGVTSEYKVKDGVVL